jgi:amidophosphoribosyltransferase
MCGILALILGDDASETYTTTPAADLHGALFYLQHREQDACGMPTCGSGGRINSCKGSGMAANEFES